MMVRAHVRYLRIAPRKVRSVINVLKGKYAEDALASLKFEPAKPAEPVAKLIRSAIANAEHNFSADPKSLKIVELKVDGGPVLKRFMPRAMGRAVPIRKRTSHVTVVLEGKRLEKAKQKPRPAAQAQPVTTEVSEDTAKEKTEQDFEVTKKVGKEQKQSFAKRIFRRKSI